MFISQKFLKNISVALQTKIIYNNINYFIQSERDAKYGESTCTGKNRIRRFIYIDLPDLWDHVCFDLHCIYSIFRESDVRQHIGIVLCIITDMLNNYVSVLYEDAS